MKKADIDTAWANVSPELIHGIRLGLNVGLARQKGKTAAQVKEDFYIEIVKLAFESGCKTGYLMGKNEG